MPITQQRMIQVLREAEEVREALASLRDNLRATIASSEEPLHVVVAIRALLDVTLVPEMPNTIREKTHFERFARKNVRNARHMEKRRREET